jgi:hypothetical protein
MYVHQRTPYRKSKEKIAFTHHVDSTLQNYEVFVNFTIPNYWYLCK